jgi:hypothetical protein
MDNATLIDDVTHKIADIIQQGLNISPGDDVMQAIRDVVIGGFGDYRASRTAYETSLGGFIVEQNPYATWEHLDFPNLPVDPNGENQWVRRSGVLSDYNALHTLPGTEPIPGGTTVDFTYADWRYLRELDEPDTNHGDFTVDDVRPQALQGKNIFTDKPPGTQKRGPQDTLPPDEARSYGHNIVKTVRLRYTIRDRHYPLKIYSKEENTEFVKKWGPCRHTGYILIQYSGSDGH